MLESLLALGLLATATPVPAAAPAAPRAPEPSVVIERRIGDLVARRLPDGRVLVSPGFTFVFSPGPDDAGTPPEWFEIASPAGRGREFSARTETLITVPRGVALELFNMTGNIRVEGWDKDVVRIVAEHGARDRLQARVVAARRQAEALNRRAAELRRHGEDLRRQGEAESRRAEAEASARDRAAAALARGTLRIETLDRMGVPGVVDYTITVPQWMALRLSGMETDISVEGVRAAIAAESVSGDVEVRGVRGPLQLSSVEGAVRAFDCAGGLTASSINDEVELDDVSGALVVESVNGDIRMGRVRSRSVEASSVNGTVVYRGAFEPRGRYRLASHAGNLVVGVPVGAGVDVSVATFEGGFHSGFPLELGPWRKGQKFNFVLGTGGSSLDLESFLGEIQLLRPAEVPAVAPAPTAPQAPKLVKIHKVPPPPSAPDPEEDR